jgi:Mg-chelatase subunit ChlD
VALILSALLCLAFIPVVGLAIDGSLAYLMRLKISTAADAAALAGARALSVGADQTAQTTSAETVAQATFNADMGTGNWGATTITESTSVTINNTSHLRSVTVSASASLPTMFMGVLGTKATEIAFTSTAQRRDVNIMLVLDHSGSMSGVLGSMQADAVDFVNMFASGRDRLGLVTFAGSPFLAFAPSTSFQTANPNVPALIDELTTYNGGTNTAQAIWMAYQQLVALNQPKAENVIVIFTDGLANNFTANFLTPKNLIAAAAGCKNLIRPLTGVIGSDTGETVVFGLFNPTATSINQPTETMSAPNTNGCANISNNGRLNTSIGSYLTGLPSKDINGNSTNGTGTIGQYAPVNLSQVNPVNVTNAGLNAFDDAANRIRRDAALKPTIYAIGLGNNPGLPPDQVLLARVANDPGSASYNSAQPAGLSVFSPTIAQLNSAFNRVAFQVLRLSQ